MKASEKLKVRLKHGNVWVTNDTMQDPEGDPVIIQVPKAAVPAYVDQGYRPLKDEEINPAEKPAAVKPAKEVEEPAKVARR
jgi:hypothetical protein